MDPTDDMIDAVSKSIPDARIVGATVLTGGSSAEVVALDVLSPSCGRRRIVFRQHANRSLKEHGPGIAAKEFHLLEWLHGSGFEVPCPLALHGDATGAGPWLAIEWIEGSTDQRPEDVDSVVVEMAAFLARLHTQACDDAVVAQLSPIEDPIEELPAYLPGDDLGRSVAEALAGGVARRPNPDVVLHGDYWPGNIMFDDRRLVAVFDWEDAAIGDPLADLACARVEILCAFGAPAAERFTAAYLDHSRPSAGRSSRTPDLFDLPLWEAYVSATALSAMHRWGLSVEEETTRRTETAAFYQRASSQLLRREQH